MQKKGAYPKKPKNEPFSERARYLKGLKWCFCSSKLRPAEIMKLIWSVTMIYVRKKKFNFEEIYICAKKALMDVYGGIDWM